MNPLKLFKWLIFFYKVETKHYGFSNLIKTSQPPSHLSVQQD